MGNIPALPCNVTIGGITTKGLKLATLFDMLYRYRNLYGSGSYHVDNKE